jgi:hypothetical protein
MLRCRRWDALCLLVLAAAPAARAQTPAAEPAPRPFLRKVIQLDDGQLQAIEKGEVVTKQLPSTEKPEIAAFGVVKVKGRIDTLRERMRDFQSFRKVPQVPEIGRFSKPPRPEDLAGLTFPEADIDAIKECKPGKCDVKIGTATLARLQKEIDWKAPDARARAAAIVKEVMVSYVKTYEEGGTDAMGVTVDKSKPKALSAEFRTLLKNSPYLVEYVPTFNQYLESYPKGSLADTDDALFWTKDTFGLKPVVSMYHATVHQEAGRGLLAAIKTLYASHYFNAALEIMAAVPAPDAATSPGFYLLDLYRTRIDPPTGMLSGVLMGKVKGGIEEGVSMNLKTAKARVEGE